MGRVHVDPAKGYDKQTLKQFCSYANISINDVRMVAKTNAQHLDALGSKNLQDVFDKKKNLDLDWEKIKRVRSIDLDAHKKIVKHKLFAQLDATNPLKVFVDSISDSIKEIQKLGDLSHNLPYVEKNNLTFGNALVELIYLTCDTWQVGLDRAMKAAVELNTK